MKYQIIPVTPFQQNCSLIWCERTKRAAVVDPGGNIDRIQNEVTKLGLVLDKIILTHGHIDHVGGAKALAQATNVPIIGPHIADKFWIDNLPKQAKTSVFLIAMPLNRINTCRTAITCKWVNKVCLCCIALGIRRDTLPFSLPNLSWRGWGIFCLEAQLGALIFLNQIIRI